MRKKRGKLTPSNSSIVLHLAPIFAARNIIHPYTYLLKLGFANNSAYKLLKGEAVQINLVQLTNLCMNLNCTPNDIFATRSMQLPDNHQLNKLQTSDTVGINPFETLKEKSLSEILESTKVF